MSENHATLLKQLEASTASARPYTTWGEAESISAAALGRVFAHFSRRYVQLVDRHRPDVAVLNVQVSEHAWFHMHQVPPPGRTVQALICSAKTTAHCDFGGGHCLPGRRST